MATFNGTELILVLNGDPVACEVSSSMTTERAPIDVTCKSSNSTLENIPGRFSATFECEALTDYDETWGINEFIDAITNKTEFEVRFKMQDSSKVYASQGILTNIAQNATADDKVTYTATIQVNGIVTNNPGAYFQFIDENWETINTNWEDI